MGYVQMTLLRDVPLDSDDGPITRWISCAGARVLNVQVTNDGIGLPAGTWAIHESNDPNAEFENRADYDPDASHTVFTDITADDRVHMIEGDGTVAGGGVWAFLISDPGRFIRLGYTRTSGGTGSKCSIFVYGPTGS